MKGTEKFVESKELLGFLTEWMKDDPLRWCDVIAASRASIEDKANALLELSKECPADKYRNPQEMAESALDSIEKTQNAPLGSVFMLGEYWRHNDDWNENCGERQTPFVTFEQARKHIAQGNGASCSSVYPDRCWFDITRWDLDENGVLVEHITWYLNPEGVIYGFSHEFTQSRQDDAYFDTIYRGCELNVRVPHQAGDIVLMDMSPFIAPFPAVIAEAEREDYTDCCHPQIIYIDKHGRIDGSALKHNPHSYPRFSPLFRLKRYDSPLEGKNAQLQIISEVIKKNPEKGEQILSAMQNELDRTGRTRGVCWNFLKDMDIFNTVYKD